MSKLRWLALAFLAGLVLAYYGLTKQKAQQQLEESPKNGQNGAPMLVSGTRCPRGAHSATCTVQKIPRPVDGV
jgi:hypothetical protein